MSKEEFLNSPFFQGIIKVLVPTLVGVIVNIATRMKKGRITKTSAFTSTIIGLGLAYMFSGPILNHVPDSWVSTCFATIGILGDKLSHWFIFEFEFKIIGDSIAGKIKKWIDNL